MSIMSWTFWCLIPATILFNSAKIQLSHGNKSRLYLAWGTTWMSLSWNQSFTGWAMWAGALSCKIDHWFLTVGWWTPWGSWGLASTLWPWCHTLAGTTHDEPFHSNQKTGPTLPFGSTALLWPLLGISLLHVSTVWMRIWILVATPRTSFHHQWQCAPACSDVRARPERPCRQQYFSVFVQESTNEGSTGLVSLTFWDFYTKSGEHFYWTNPLPGQLSACHTSVSCHSLFNLCNFGRNQFSRTQIVWQIFIIAIWISQKMCVPPINLWLWESVSTMSTSQLKPGLFPWKTLSNTETYFTSLVLFITCHVSNSDAYWHSLWVAAFVLT